MKLTAKDIINKRKELWELNKDPDLDKKYIHTVADYICDKDKGADVRAEIKADPSVLIEMVFVVVDKNKNTIPFFLNEVQVEFLGILKDDIAKFKRGEILHLQYLIDKGRQQGFTTCISAYQLSCALTTKNFAGFTLADDAENTESIFTDKAKFFYDNLPEKLKPTEKYNNRRELHFAKEDGTGLNSRWRVATAGAKSPGRSKTINFFHGSEAAFWDSISAIMIGLKAALTKDAIQILESTPNGFNEYKELWDDETNNWKKLFFEWWKTKEYRMPFESESAEKQFKKNVEDSIQNTNTDSEMWCFYRCKWLRDKIGLEWNQIYWYYQQWKDYKGNIRQEYPCTAEEGFLASGSSIFDTDIVATRIKELEIAQKKNPYRKGYFEYEYKYIKNKDKFQIIDDTIKWVDSENGFIRIYFDAEDGYPYLLSGDTAGEPGKNSDAFTGQMINNITGKQVASLENRMNEDLYARQMYCLGKMFNDALIVIEANYTRGPLKELDKLGYPNIYLRETEDDIAKTKIMKPGFLTTTITRPVILANLVKVVRESIEVFYDIPTLKEMLTFVKDDKNKAQAESGKHDDLVMAAAIGYYTRPSQRMDIKKEVEKVEGYYTKAELQDMGYKPFEIKRIMEGGMKPWK